MSTETTLIRRARVGRTYVDESVPITLRTVPADLDLLPVEAYPAGVVRMDQYRHKARMPGSNRAYTTREKRRPFAAGRIANVAVCVALACGAVAAVLAMFGYL